MHRLTRGFSALFVAALLAGLAPGVACAETALFSDYRSLCLDTRGAPAAVAAKAAGTGWVEPPIDVSPLLGSLPIKGAKVRIKLADRRLAIALFGRGQLPGGSLPGDWDICAVAHKPLEAQAAQDLAAWTGVPRFVRPNAPAGEVLYIFTDEGGRRALQTLPPEEGRRLLQAHQAEAASLQVRGEVALLVFGRQAQ